MDATDIFELAFQLLVQNQHETGRFNLFLTWRLANLGLILEIPYKNERMVICNIA